MPGSVTFVSETDAWREASVADRKGPDSVPGMFAQEALRELQ